MFQSRLAKGNHRVVTAAVDKAAKAVKAKVAANKVEPAAKDKVVAEKVLVAEKGPTEEISPKAIRPKEIRQMVRVAVAAAAAVRPRRTSCSAC